MEKLHKQDVTPVEKENERDENYQADNPQIDSERTSDNYHIVKRKESYTEYINKRIKELNLPTAIRKDAVLVDSFVIGSDGEFFKGLTKEKEKEFFTDCVKYFADTYGTENIISAVVHRDETTPHLHLNLIPITKDGRLCSKALFDKNKLSKLQTDFHNAVGAKYGLSRGKEGSQRKHLDTAEYKAQMIKGKAYKESQDLRQANELAEKHFDETMKEIENAKAERDKIIRERNAEGDYSQALNEAKQGIVSKKKGKLEQQITSLIAENKRLEDENTRLKRDNEDLFKRNKGFAREREAMEVVSLFRKHAPMTFARVLCMATALVESFIPKDQPITKQERNRLDEIKEEIAREKEKGNAKSDDNKNSK